MKKIFAIIMLLAIAITMCGCNKQVIDTDYQFNYAIIFLPDGSQIEGSVSKWNDYADSDMVQVKINGTTYLTHSANVILMNKK